MPPAPEMLIAAMTARAAISVPKAMLRRTDSLRLAKEDSMVAPSRRHRRAPL
jgi:hypothetical protein